MKQKLWFFTLLVSLSALVQAGYHNVRSQKEFESLINKYRYTAVCFAPSDEMKDEFRDLKSIMKAAANSDVYHRYLRKDIGFLVVDVGSKRAYEIPHEYALSKFPSCLVFQSGSLALKQPLVDPKTSYDVLRMLEQQFGKKIVEMVKERKEDERVMRAERIASYYALGSTPYWYPYAYWPYSRWGAYPYYGGWSYGFAW